MTTFYQKCYCLLIFMDIFFFSLWLCNIYIIRITKWMYNWDILFRFNFLLLDWFLFSFWFISLLSFPWFHHYRQFHVHHNRNHWQAIMDYLRFMLPFFLNKCFSFRFCEKFLFLLDSLKNVSHVPISFLLVIVFFLFDPSSHFFS